MIEFGIDIDYINQMCDIEKLCFSDPWSEKSFKDEIDNPFAIYFLQKDMDNILGYIGCHNILGDAYITNIAVLPAYRKKGIANRLLNNLIDYGINEKFNFLSLEVRISNQNAINLYEKNGFAKVGFRKNFYSKPNEDAHIMNYKF